MRYVFAIPAAIFLVVGLGWVFAANDLALYQYFAPRQEAARRAVFEESRAFNQGVAQDLQQLRLDYGRAPPADRPALAAMILHRVAGYDVERLPPDVRDFIDQIRRGS